MRPGTQHLCRRESTNPRLLQQLWREVLDEDLDVRLQIVGFGLQHQNAPRGTANRNDGRPMLGVMMHGGAKAGTSLHELVSPQRSQMISQLLGCGDHERFEMTDGSALGVDRALTGTEQHADCLAIAAASWLSQKLAAERFTSGSGCIQLVALRPITPSGTRRSIDLGYWFALLKEVGGQATAEAARAFDRPEPLSRGALLGEGQNAAISEGIGRYGLCSQFRTVQGDH